MLSLPSLVLLLGSGIVHAWPPSHPSQHGRPSWSGHPTQYPTHPTQYPTTLSHGNPPGATPTCSAAGSETLAPTVTLSAGVVIGTTTNLASATAAVNKFLGVPFALSPPPRFSLPQAPEPFSAPVIAQAWKPACIQEFIYPLAYQTWIESVFNQPTPQESEDCLYLNVYAPSSPPPPGGRAVMFWIYGGGLVFGNAGQPIYDGSAFAAYQDVIVVSTNYRLNVFGFPNAPEIPVDQQNLGLLDQRFALTWVQENIGLFGGDPAKVTIFGESAGGQSVDALLTSFTTETAPFRAAILESGQMSYRPDPGVSGRVGWDGLTAALNCTSQTSNVSCVQAASADTIRTIIDELSLPFSPVVDNITWVANGAANRQAGNFAKVPVLTGTNADESRVFTYGQNNYTAFLDATFAFIPELIPDILAAFPRTAFATDYDALSTVDTLFFFQCPQVLFANESAAVGVPTWRYWLDAEFPNNSPLNGLLEIYHASELNLVYGTYSGGPVNPVTPVPTDNDPTNLPPTAQQAALSQFMNGAWANFAKDPAHGPGWNQLGTFNVDIAALGANGSSGATLIDRSIDAACSLFLPAYQLVNGDVYGL